MQSVPAAAETSTPFGPFIDKHAARAGVDPNVMRRIMQIESGGDAGNRTGSYHGLFQLSWPEFKKYGGQGNIYDPDANAAVAANKLAAESANFKAKYNRDPTPTDMYLMHQQGEGGYAAHLANPAAPAWKNMYFTAEGREKGSGWAKQAIWGNIPDQYKRQFGSVENVTSRDFVNMWQSRVEGGGFDGGDTSQTARGGTQDGQPTATAGLDPAVLGRIMKVFKPGSSGIASANVGDLISLALSLHSAVQPVPVDHNPYES